MLVKTPDDDQKHCELRIATYVTCHTSVSAVEDLLDIIQDKVGAFQMHRTKCTAVIKSVLMPHFRKLLREDIGESPYSLYLGETTGISVNKLLCVCVKYQSVKHSKFISAYLGLVELFGLDIKNMMGMGKMEQVCSSNKCSQVYSLFAVFFILWIL